MKSQLSYLFALLLVCVVSGCSSATPTTRDYLLSNPDQPSASDTSCNIRVGSATVAPYLQRTHIVLQNGTNELVPAVRHRWSEPLEAGVSRLLTRCLGNGGQSGHKANVHIDHLHGSTEGRVVIQARWSVSGVEASDVQAPVERQFTSSMPQPVAGYDALVSSQRALVLELCADIKSSVPDC